MFLDALREARRKRIEKILERVEHRDVIKRYLLLTIGCFIVAFAFNVFFCSKI